MLVLRSQRVMSWLVLLLVCGDIHCSFLIEDETGDFISEPKFSDVMDQCYRPVQHKLFVSPSHIDHWDSGAHWKFRKAVGQCTQPSKTTLLESARSICRK